jgi:hypothetical protein
MEFLSLLDMKSYNVSRYSLPLQQDCRKLRLGNLVSILPCLAVFKHDLLLGKVW